MWVPPLPVVAPVTCKCPIRVLDLAAFLSARDRSCVRCPHPIRPGEWIITLPGGHAHDRCPK